MTNLYFLFSKHSLNLLNQNGYIKISSYTLKHLLGNEVLVYQLRYLLLNVKVLFATLN